MKVLPLPCKRVDLRVARKIASLSPVGDVQNSIPNYYFPAKHIDSQIRCIFIINLAYCNDKL